MAALRAVEAEVNALGQHVAVTFKEAQRKQALALGRLAELQAARRSEAEQAAQEDAAIEVEEEEVRPRGMAK